MDYNMKEIGERIRNIRIQKNITQEKLAEMTGLTPSHISKIISGTSRLSLDSLINIAEVLEVSTDEIIFGHIRNGKDRFYDSYTDLMLDCNDSEKKILIEISKTLKEQIREEKGKL